MTDMVEASPLVERVARVIYEASGDRTGWPWDRSVLGGKEYWKRIARAAIQDMQPGGDATRIHMSEVDAALIPTSDVDVQGISQGRGE